MLYAELVLGCSTFFLAAAGLLTSFEAVNEMFPPTGSRAETRRAQSPMRKEDRLLGTPVADKIENSQEAAAEAEPHLNRLCTGLEGKPFGWDWPNVPFAALTCDIPRRK